MPLMRAFLLLLVLQTNAYAGDPWEPADKLLLGSAVGLLATDWGQSRTIARAERVSQPCLSVRDQPAQCAPVRERVYHETNPFLPANPSTAEVDRYFVLAIGGTVAASFLLPATPRRWLLGGIVVLETVVVIRNHRLGIGLAF